MENTKTPKDLEQELVFKKLKENYFFGTWLAATGCGKTRLGLMCLKYIIDCMKSAELNPADFSFLIVTPTTKLRDGEWIEEFKKVNMEDYLQYVTIECIQTAYKFSEKTFLFGIVDEVHTSLSTEYKKLFLNNTFNSLICLTATLEDKEKIDFVNSIAPIVHITDTERALNLGLITDFTIYNIPVDMSKENKSKLNKINYLYGKAEEALGGKYRAYDNAKQFRTLEHKQLNAEEYKNACLFWAQMKKRSYLLNNSVEKIEITKKLIEEYFIEEKVLIFCSSIETGDLIMKALNETSYISTIYHSKLSEKEKNKNFSDFVNNTYRVLISINALNAGVNVPECSVAINFSGSSKQLSDIQRRGRIVRLDYNNPNKKAIYVNLFFKNTQEEKWLTSRLQNINKQYIKEITNLKQIKKHEQD